MNARAPKRPHETFELRVGEQKIYVGLGRWADRPGSVEMGGRVMEAEGISRVRELFFSIAKDGAALRGYMDQIARLASRSLQFGVPLEAILDQWIGVALEPAGKGSLHPAIEGRQCPSLLDAIARVLDAEFCGGQVAAKIEKEKENGTPER